MGRGGPGSQKTRLIGKEQLDGVRQAKKRLAVALQRHGIRWVERIIEAGPAQVVASNQKDRPREAVSEFEMSESRQLFQWAMTFAADRGGGMPRQTDVQVAAGTEGVPEITVNIVGHARPTDT